MSSATILNVKLTHCSLFVCKYKTGPNGRADELDVQFVLPIYGQFSVVIGQMRRGSSDLLPNMTAKAMLDQPRTG